PGSPRATHPILHATTSTIFQPLLNKHQNTITLTSNTGNRITKPGFRFQDSLDNGTPARFCLGS
ncbi:MAG: hypothetical protein ACODAD_15580, partial [Planctomycetota bacterium]